MINLSNAFKPTNEGTDKSYIGMNVSKNPNGTITMSHPEKVIMTKYFAEAWFREVVDQVGSVFKNRIHNQIREVSNRLDK